MQVRLQCGGVELAVRLNETATAKKIWEALPIEAEASTWGDEVYFTVPVQAEQENPQELVAEGDVAYWPPGRALCVFFGPTPVSGPGEIRPYSPVTVVGKVVGDAKVLKGVKDGDKVRILRWEA